MAVVIDVDDAEIELSDDHAVRVSELSQMFFALILSVCDETDTNFCELAVDLSRQIAGNMILNGHVKCAHGFRQEIEDAIKFLSQKAAGETTH